MKKKDLILFIVTYLLTTFAILFSGCRKTQIMPTPQPVVNIFSVRESSVENGQEIQFELTQTGVYTLTIGDSVTKQVLTRERFIGQIGQNKKKIYTKGLESKYLYLLLEDVTKNKLGKTIIIVK
jgi:hypothetical protein